MARFLVMSDVHIEFGDMHRLDPKELGPLDGILLAGDVMPWINCVLWADTLAKHLSCPAVVIAGNHEFYARAHPDRTIGHTLSALYVSAEKTQGRVTFLENDAVTIAGIRILGTTLWTDFALFGDATRTFAMRAAQTGLNDFMICWQERGKAFSPSDVVALHDKARLWLIDALDGRPVPTIVMTHHAPSLTSVPVRFRGDLVSAAYASNLDFLVENSGAQLWIHGHTHDSFDYTIGKTRVLCNPRGYRGREPNLNFNPKLVVEL